MRAWVLSARFPCLTLRICRCRVGCLAIVRMRTTAPFCMQRRSWATVTFCMCTTRTCLYRPSRANATCKYEIDVSLIYIFIALYLIALSFSVCVWLTDVTAQEILEFIDVQDSQSDPRFPAAHAFTGDFNTLPNATEIRTILAAGFTDVWSGQEQDLDGERRHSYASAGDALGGFAAAGFDADALSPHRMASTAQLSCRPVHRPYPLVLSL